MKNKFQVIIVAVALTLSSCMVTRTTIGDGPVGKGEAKKVYSKTKQVYLFWGFIALGANQPKIPDHKNIQVKTSYNVADALVTGLSGGLFAMQTIKILVKKEDMIKYQNMANKNIEKGKKVIFTSSGQQQIGEVISIDNTKGKATVKYLNSYGERLYKDKKYESLNPISEEEYQKSISKQKSEIQKHKFSNNEKVTWIKHGESFFGTITLLDDKSHKATVEYLNVFHEKEFTKVDYLELNKLSNSQFAKMMQAQKEKEKKYKFTVGEKVRFKSLTGGEGEGKIIILNDTSHKATIEFLNKKNEKKTTTVSYLNIFKK